MSATCKECGAAFKTKPFSGCPYCGNADVAIEAEKTPETLVAVQDEAISEEQTIKTILMDMAEDIHGSSYSKEIFSRIVDRTIERLKKETVKA